MAKKDFTQVAFAVMQAATGQAPKPFTEKQVNSRKGGLKGGTARMAGLTETQRKELAAKAVAARKKAPTKTVGAGLAIKK